MKLYLVAPVIPVGANPAAIDARLEACIEPIADLILPHLLPDPALFGMRHDTEVSDPPLAPTERYGDVQVVRLADVQSLRAVLLGCGDPNSGQWMLIRSLVSCRSVSYGYDGQAFVCLPHDAPPILSPDDALIEVSDCSERLLDTDWMDGLLLH